MIVKVVKGFAVLAWLILLGSLSMAVWSAFSLELEPNVIAAWIVLAALVFVGITIVCYNVLTAGDTYEFEPYKSPISTASAPDAPAYQMPQAIVIPDLKNAKPATDAAQEVKPPAQ